MADSSSTSAFISTLIIYGLTAVVFVWLFLLLRPKKEEYTSHGLLRTFRLFRRKRERNQFLKATSGGLNIYSRNRTRFSSSTQAWTAIFC